MAYYFFQWTDEIIDHIAQHGISPEEFEEIVCFPRNKDSSRSSGLPIAFGYAEDGRLVACVFELIDDMNVIPVTAYEVED